MFQVIWKGNQYTNKGSRGGTIPVAITNHITDGTAESAINWFRDPNNKESSAHFVVTKNGLIYQFVKIEEKAWHNGVTVEEYKKTTSPLALELGRGTNYYTIGIEHESCGEALTEIQYQASLWLHNYIIDYVKKTYNYDIPRNRKNIIGHYEINPVNRPYCPGINFPWNRLILDLNATAIPAQWQVESMNFLYNNGFIKNQHKYNEEVNLASFAYMINNYTTKLNPVEPMTYLNKQNYIKSSHQQSEQLTWALLGYMLMNKYNEQTLKDPIQFMISRKFISQSKNPTAIVNYSEIGAVFNNILKNGGIL